MNKRTTIIVAAVVLIAVAAVVSIPVLQRLPVKGIPRGWSVIEGNPDQWQSKGDDIVAHAVTGNSLLVSSKQYGDITLSADVRSTREASFALRMREPGRGYLVVFVPAGNSWEPGNGHIEVVRLEPNNDTTLKSYRGRVLSTLGDSAKITVTANGPWLEVFLNDVSVIRVKDSTYAMGFAGLRVYGWGDHPCDVTYSHLRFY